MVMLQRSELLTPHLKFRVHCKTHLPQYHNEQLFPIFYTWLVDTPSYGRFYRDVLGVLQLLLPSRVAFAASAFTTTIYGKSSRSRTHLLEWKKKRPFKINTTSLVATTLPGVDVRI